MAFAQNAKPAASLATQEIEATHRLRVLDKAATQGRVRIVVGLQTDALHKPQVSDRQAMQNWRRALARSQNRVLDELTGHNVSVLGKFRYVNFVTLEVDSLAVEVLAGLDEVVSIREDIHVAPQMASSNVVIGSPDAWAAGFAGQGHVVAILDTGVDSQHPYFATGQAKVVSEACFSSTGSTYASVCPGGVSESTAVGSGANCATTISGCTHGTHVAGSAAGNDQSGPNFGVARDAEIIAIQVFSRFDSSGDCSPAPTPCARTWFSDVARGLERVFDLRDTFDIAAANLSLGNNSRYTAACDFSFGSLKSQMDNLLSVGIATVVSSGNSQYTDGISAPACISTAISVGAVTDSDSVASFSNVSSNLDLLAPGVSIRSSVPGGGTANWNGTSMAAPHVTGAWAIMKQAKPDATVAEVLAALTNAGTLVDDNRSGATVTNMPRINVDLASQNIIGASADLSVSNLDSVDPVAAGATFDYTLSVTNAGPTSAANVVVTDTLPAEANFVSATGTGWSCSESAGTVSCTRSSLAVGAAPAITATVTAPAQGTSLSNTVGVSSNTADPNAVNNTATESTVVSALADLSMSKVDSVDPVEAGATFDYTLSVTNAGPSSAANVVVTDTLPAEVNFVSATGTGWSCSESAGTVSCTRSILAVGAAPVITATVTAPAHSTTLSNSVSVAADTADPNASDNTVTESTVVSALADLSVGKVDSLDPVAAGATFDYTLSVTNAGPSSAANVAVTDTLPAEVTFVSATGTGWSCSESAGTLSCTRSTLAVGAAPVITATVTAPAQGTSLSNTVTVAADTTDPNTSDNTATESTVVSALADLSMSKVDSVDPVEAGATFDYTLSVNNSGPSSASNIVVTDTLPAEVTFVSANGTGWSCSESAGTVSCTRSILAVGAAPVITATVIAPAQSTTLSNSVSVAADTTDPNTSDNTATESTVVRALADLSMSKVDSVDPVEAGATFDYTLSVNNSGPSSAANVVVTDTLPAEVTFVSATGTGWSCSESAGTVSCTRSILAVGAAPVITATVTAPAQGTSLSNTVTVAADTTDPNASDNTATESTVVSALADLSMSKVDSVDPVEAGATFDYTLSVTNAGPSSAGNVVVTDTLPAELTFVSATGTGWSCSESAGTVSCTRSILAVGAAPVITATVTAPAQSTTLSNSVSVAADTADPNASDNTVTESTVVSALADLSVGKVDSSDPVAAGATFDYTLSVTNAGPSSAANVAVTDTLPAEVTFVSATGTGWSCSESAGTVSCTRSTLAVGAAPVITATVTAPAQGTSLSNTVTVSSDTADPNASDNTATESTVVSALADLSVSKVDSLDPVAAGATFGYTLSVTNAGPSSAANVAVTDTLPAEVTFVSANGTGWSCSESAGTLSCTRSSLAVGAATVITATVTAPTQGTSLSNTVTVAADTADPNATDNTATESTVVSALADLSMIKVDSVDPVAASATFDYTLSVTNAGPSSAANVVVTDTLPAEVTFVSATGTGWSCSESAGTLSCTRSTLAVGAAPVITATVTAPAHSTTLSNSVSVAADTADPNASDNTATESTVVSALADLSVSKVDSLDPVSAGATFDYTLSVTNVGPSSAANVVVTDTLPAEVTFVSATGTGWSCSESAGTVSCTRSSLAVGAAPVITATVTAPVQSTTLSNSVSVAADTTDPNASDNTATESTVVSALADLSVIKVDSLDPVASGTTFDYTLSVTNAGPSSAANVVVIDTLPAEVTFVSATGTGWSCSESAGTLSCTRSSLAVGAAPVITATVTAPAQGTSLSNTVGVSSNIADPNAVNNTATESTVVSALADLAVTKVDSLDPVAAGTTFDYTLSVTNAGPSSAANVVVADTLPADVTFVSASGTGWSCSESAGTLSCTRSILAVGAAPVITATVTAPAQGTSLSNTVGVSSDTADPNAVNNTATESTVVSALADLAVTKVDSLDPVAAGTTFDYTLSVTNAGPSSAANVVVADTLPADVTFVSASGTGWSCSESAGTVSCTRSSLAVGAAPVITATVTAQGTSLSNTVTVAADTADPNASDNTATESTVVSALADLAVIKLDSLDPVAAGTTFDYTLSVTNAGPSSAANVVVADTLPAEVTFVSANGTGWSCSESAGTLSCTRSSLAVGAAPVITATVTAPTQGTTLSNTVTVAADTPDPNTTDNTATESTVVTVFADLMASTTDSIDPVAVGATFDYTLSVTNAGPSSAANVVVTDTLPADVTFVSATGMGWSCSESAGTLSCARDSLAPGAAPDITATVTAPMQDTTLLNTVSVAANTAEPNVADNTDAEVTRVGAGVSVPALIEIIKFLILDDD